MLTLVTTAAAFSPAPHDTATGCGVAPGSLVELSNTLVIGMCSDGALRVVRHPIDAKAALMGRRSLMVAPDFPSSVPKFEVTKAAGVTTTITTATIKAVVEDEAEEIGFYDAQSGAELTRDYGAAFTATTDPALGTPSYTISQSWTLAPNEGLYGGGEFQNGLVGFQGAPLLHPRT
jgi:hypothetical protein